MNNSTSSFTNSINITTNGTTNRLTFGDNNHYIYSGAGINNMNFGEYTGTFNFINTAGGNSINFNNGAITSTSLITNNNCTVNGIFYALYGASINVMNQQDGGIGRALYIWNYLNSDWAIYMAQSGTGKSLSAGYSCLGFGQSLPCSQHALRFRVAASANNGFIFENSSEQALFSIKGDDGYAYMAGSLNVNGSLITNNANLGSCFCGNIILQGSITLNQYAFIQTQTATQINWNYQYYASTPQNARSLNFLVNGNMIIYNANTTALWSANTQISDRRFKENIIISQMNAIEIINKLEVVEYNYTKEIDEKQDKKIGLIAQDTIQIINQCVKFIENEYDISGNYLINYELIVPYLIKGFQEQQITINNLIKELNDLKLKFI